MLRLPKKLFYLVEIHDTEKSMHAAVSKLRGRKCDKNARAICLRYQYDGTVEGLTPIGTVYFTQADCYRPAIVLHELTHAAIGYCNRAGLNPMKSERKQNSDEEKFVTVLQDLFEQYFETLVPPDAKRTK
jgi:hypothetical protein